MSINMYIHLFFCSLRGLSKVTSCPLYIVFHCWLKDLHEQTLTFGLVYLSLINAPCGNYFKGLFRSSLFTRKHIAFFRSLVYLFYPALVHL